MRRSCLGEWAGDYFSCPFWPWPHSQARQQQCQLVTGWGLARDDNEPDTGQIEMFKMSHQVRAKWRSCLYRQKIVALPYFTVFEACLIQSPSADGHGCPCGRAAFVFHSICTDWSSSRCYRLHQGSLMALAAINGPYVAVVLTPIRVRVPPAASPGPVLPDGALSPLHWL